MKEDFLQRKLQERREKQSFRQLKPVEDAIDFCSNDYLGIARNRLLRQATTLSDHLASGSGGSRLLAGNYALLEETEQFIASFHNAEAALIFNSGYDANLGLFSCVPQRGDTILFDNLSHASIRDGIRLSFAQSFSFAHNDVSDLESKLCKAQGTIFVVTESVFSMDGDSCPLAAMVKICEQYQAHLIIDEAHATGVIGSKGEGLVQKLGLEKSVFARIHTFGKACGVHGAAILGSGLLKDYLVNFARPFIYTTALPPQSAAHILASYRLFPQMVPERAHLATLISRFSQLADGLETLPSTTPIQAVIIPGNSRVREVAAVLQQNRLDVRPVLYPTVPAGKERLRIVLHSFNTQEELDFLLNCLKNSV